ARAPAGRDHHAGRQTHGAAHQARQGADDEAQGLRRQRPPAPGARPRRVQVEVRTRTTMATATAAKKKYYLGTGRRKTSVARVRLSEGTGKISINGRELNDFFTELKDRAAVTGPLALAE